MVAYAANSRLWIRDLDQVESREIPDSDGAILPFWSPQSDFVGYFDLAGGTFKRVSVHGGPSTLLCQLPVRFFGGATWRPDGTIVFGSRSLYEVSAEGGEPMLLMQPDSTKGEVSFWDPHLLPDGKSLVFGIFKKDQSEDLVVQAGDTQTRLLHSNPGEFITGPQYAPTGHLLYYRGSGTSWNVWAAPFSLSSLTVTGKPVLVAQNGSWPSVSSDGTLVYASGTSGLNQLVWVDRSGRVTGTIGQPQESLRSPALSPDGQRIAVNATENNNTDIWIHDVTRGTRTRLTSDPGIDRIPIWTPTGDQVVFESTRSGAGDIFLQAADGSSAARPLVTDPRRELTPDWSRDGQYLVYTMDDPKTRHDLWYVPLTGERKPVLFLQTSFREARPALSPDGRYVAYQSDESGQYEIYVQPFPRGAGKEMVSVKGGVHPRWRGDEIFYVDVEGNALMGVKVDTRSGFRAELPRQLFTGEQVRARLYNPPTDWQTLYDVAPDGQRVVVVQTASVGTTAITVVENWVEEFRK